LPRKKKLETIGTDQIETTESESTVDAIEQLTPIPTVDAIDVADSPKQKLPKQKLPKQKLLMILASAPSVPNIALPKVDPQREIAMYTPQYLNFILKIKEFAETEL